MVAAVPCRGPWTALLRSTRWRSPRASTRFRWRSFVLKCFFKLRRLLFLVMTCCRSRGGWGPSRAASAIGGLAQPCGGLLLDFGRRLLRSRGPRFALCGWRLRNLSLAARLLAMTCTRRTCGALLSACSPRLAPSSQVPPSIAATGWPHLLPHRGPRLRELLEVPTRLRGLRPSRRRSRRHRRPRLRRR